MPITQLQVLHDVRELDFLPVPAWEDGVHQFGRKLIEVGRDGPRLRRGERSDVASREAVRVPFRRMGDEIVPREERGQGAAEGPMLHHAGRNQGNNRHRGTARRSLARSLARSAGYTAASRPRRGC